MDGIQYGANPGQTELVARAIAEIADLPQNQSQSFPAASYLDQGLFELEREKIFKKSWMPIAHESELPEPGSFVNVDLFGEPMVAVRGKDDQIRVLSRVCRHRGMDMALPHFGRPQRGHANTLLCPYHFWGYDLSGQLRSAKHMEEATDFDPKSICLKSFRSAVWQGFVWLTFDDSLSPIEEVYGELGERLAPWNIGRLKEFISIEWDCAFNWKMLIENFMEPYHHMGAHVKSFEVMLPTKGCWTEDEHENFMVGHLPFSPSILDDMKSGSRTPCTLPEITGVSGQDREEWTVYCGMPLFLFLTAPEKVYWYRIFPDGPDRLRLTTMVLVDPAVMELPDVEERRRSEELMLRDFHTEDMEVLVGMQRGAASSGYAPGRLSHLEKAIWLLQRYLARTLHP